MKKLLTFSAIMLFLSSITGQKCLDHAVRTSLTEKYGSSILDYSNFDWGNTHYRSNPTIQVVFHVVYNTDDENVSDDRLVDQIEILNESFAGAFNQLARDTFAEVLGESPIRFELASIDPEGRPTTGITRTKTNKETWMELDLLDILLLLGCLLDPINCEFDELLLLNKLDKAKSSLEGGIDPWDPSRYLNIWVINMELTEATPFLLGFAYPPVNAPLFEGYPLPTDLVSKDGIVVQHQAIAGGPATGAYETIDQGFTLIHEAGHYLGLRHIWGDGDCTLDDGLDDTPAAAQPSNQGGATACGDLHKLDSCLDDDLPDMIENFMDYSAERCQTSFTKEQVDMMMLMLDGPRRSLIEGVSSTADFNDFAISISPNPTADKVIVSLSQPDKIHLYDSYGKVLYTSEKSSQVVIDASAYPSGIYYIKSNVGVKTFVKM